MGAPALDCDFWKSLPVGAAVRGLLLVAEHSPTPPAALSGCLPRSSLLNSVVALAGPAYLTIASIFFLYFTSILLRYSGLMSIAAKLNAEFFRPARWHLITVDVRIGTISATRRWQSAHCPRRR